MSYSNLDKVAIAHDFFSKGKEMKKKVGIITIHYVDNLGGILLAYALQESVNRFGYDCFVIDYDPTPLPSHVRHFVNTMVRRVTQLPRYLINFPAYFKLFIGNCGAVLPPRHIHGSSGLRKARFDTFRKRFIKLSEKHFTSKDSLKESPPLFDAYITGSDQVWNPFICKSPEHPTNEYAYFLTFAPQAKRISYAPSISIPQIPEELQVEMAELLQGIPYLSCREKQGADLIEEMTNRVAEVVLDPTLLLNFDEWSRIAIEPQIEEPYILGYFLGDGRGYRDFARKLAENTGCRLVIISRDRRDVYIPGNIDCCEAGPAEFLGLVRNSRCICTDSFHGTIFSINFCRPFYAFERPGSHGVESMASRIYSILEILGLTSRLLMSDSPCPDKPFEIDYSAVQIRLQIELAKSLQYLEEALRQATLG